MSDAELQPNETQDPPAVQPQGEEPPAEPTGTPPADAPEPEGDEPTEEDAPEGDEPQPEGKRKRTGGFQRKIERLERLTAQQAEVIDRLSRPGQPGTPAPSPAQMTDAEKTQAALDALIDQRVAAREAERRGQERVEAWTKRTAEVRAAHADYDDVVAAAPPIHPQSPVGQALLKLENGPEMLYQLQRTGELARIGALPPLDAALEIGRLEAKLASVAPARQTSQATRRTSAAPAPITPVTARGPSNVKPVEQMTYEEYNAWRNSQQRKP
jgi:hypothetical protein